MIYMWKYLGGSVQMSVTDFEMHQKMRWIEGWMHKGMDGYVVKQVKC